MNKSTPVLEQTELPAQSSGLGRWWKLFVRQRTFTEIAMDAFSALALMIIGHLVFSYFTWERITGFGSSLTFTDDIFYYLLAGFVAQMIDGALGMAYGVTATTFLLTLGVPASAASASVHSSEIFTSGVSGYLHLKFGNVNSKLFKIVLIPGIIGAALGAYILVSLENYVQYIKPVVAVYTAFLGFLIIKKALVKRTEKKTFKPIGWLALFGGTMDSVGGGGWGPIVSSTLIASGRHPKYTIGSVNLAEFFVSLTSSITFITLIGLTHWQVIAGLILGGTAAAPIAARLAGRLPVKTMMLLVGIVVIIVSLRNILTVIL
ncbi:MAG: sulfite exporter TauE/SafE family protein [Cytophagia bacterium]|nr:MAG: sulfite exporter TauE/SafE family protein [Runella sp.]TAG23217.1 MAG: sulfite exporter TauE/SafE family protein [Cytophagales bacterium]TAG37225.1 MAG: sulfite exporter TauE/SafE family protein [Cytophagia bacterium]TAG50681.1 MAG: sulfite exporter TauE/SafE family protein [Runella slithyformis]TAG66814.1 MAG: sulfite exporter TauE/SafE family protein [Runella slithyformis]